MLSVESESLRSMSSMYSLAQIGRNPPYVVTRSLRGQRPRFLPIHCCSGAAAQTSSPTPPETIASEEKQRWVENSGKGKTYHKTTPQKRFWTPSPMIRFLPPFVHTMSFSLREWAQTRPIPLSEASKTGFGGHALWYVSPPKIARYVLPPH